MQLIGLGLLMFVVWFGFQDRGVVQISAFDPHAIVIVLLGSGAAVLVSSSSKTAWRTIACLRELVPAWGRLSNQTQAIEAERSQLSVLWHEGKRAQAVALAEKSDFPLIKKMLELIVNRAPHEATAEAFLGLRHRELGRWQPPIHNWEMLAKLGPSFGMVGTITGMIQLFRNMSEENLNIGAAMSLALLATLYGVAFGAGVAGPIGHYLNGLLDERMGVLERAEQSVTEIIAVSGADLRAAG